MSFVEFFLGGLAFSFGIVATCAIVGVVVRTRINTKKARKEAADAKENEEAEKHSRNEAEEKARAAAEAKAHEEAEEHARNEAEEKAREEAEDQAREEAEEQAYLALHQDFESVLYQAFQYARHKRKLEVTCEIVAFALLCDNVVQTRLSDLGVDRHAAAEVLERLIDAQPDGSPDVDDVQSSADFLTLVTACFQRYGRQVDPLGALHVTLSQPDSTVSRAFATFSLTGARLRPPTVNAPLDILKESDIQQAPALPVEQEKALRYIIDAFGAGAPLRLAINDGAATICLLNIQECDERQAALSIARLMPGWAPLHIPASSLGSHTVAAIYKQVREATQLEHRLLLWISGVNGHEASNVEKFLSFMEQCQALPSTVFLLHAFDSQHVDATRLRRVASNIFQVSWPRPDHQRQIQALCERQAALSAIETERPGWIKELAHMAEGMSTNDVSEVFARAELVAIMAGAIAPSFAMLCAAFEEVHRHSRNRSGTTGDSAHVRTRARMRLGSGNVRGLDSLAGMENVKHELNRYRALVADRARFIAAGCRVPRGLLLKGTPGVGKTAVARAFADSLGRPFFSVTGSEFDEMYVGVGAARVRDLFESARLAQPCVVFIDELDTIGKQRDGGGFSSASTLNQLLVEMDGFDVSDGVFVMGATNRVDILDPALTRAGRFDAIIEVPIPDDKTREAILRMLLGERHHMNEGEIVALIESTESFVGADLENMVNRARIDAVSNGGDGHVTHAQLKESLEHVVAARPENLNDSRHDSFFY